MIREDLSRSEGVNPQSSRTLDGPRPGAVTAEERHLRHGHRAAIFSVVGNPAFAERFERSLFERGFHAILVRTEEVSSTSLLSVLSALQDAGAVVIHSSVTNLPELQAVLADVAGESLFEIPASEKNEEEALRQALGLAEELRSGVGGTSKGKVNGNAFTD